MKLLLLQDFWQVFLGVASISAVVKSRGHECRVHIDDGRRAHLRRVMRDYQPDVIGFTCMTSSVRWALRTARVLRAECPSAKFIMGGVHPTLCPDVVEDEAFDLICRGEGEFPVTELLDALASGGDYAHIPNLWVKTPQGIVRNEMRPLIADLDQLPLPDREAYYAADPLLRQMESKAVMVGRGCPYPCTFCANHRYMELYRGKGRYVRRRSAARVLDEIAALQASGPLHHIYFNDDTFTLDLEWLRDFLPRYRQRFGVPFTCGTRADLVSEDLVSLLAANGCRVVEMGIETGNENLRRHVLKKRITDEECVQAARLIKGAGLRLKTSNMIGLPGETVAMAFETIELNRRCRTDFANCSILQPYPGLEITTYAMECGLLSTDFDFTSLAGMSYRRSALRLPELRALANLQRFFLLCLKLPRLDGVVRRLIRLPPNPVFDALFKLSYVINYARYHGMSLAQVAKLALRSSRHY